MKVNQRPTRPLVQSPMRCRLPAGCTGGQSDCDSGFIVFLSTPQLNRPVTPRELPHAKCRCFVVFLNITKPKYVKVNDIVKMVDFVWTVEYLKFPPRPISSSPSYCGASANPSLGSRFASIASIVGLSADVWT